MAMFMFFLTVFMFSWCFTTDTLIPFLAMMLTILSLILFGLYILKRDLHSVLIYMKESTGELERKP